MEVFDRSVTIFDRDSAIDRKSIIKVYHGRFIPCRFSCQSREMYNKKRFILHARELNKKKKKKKIRDSNLLRSALKRIHESRLMLIELRKVIEKIQVSMFPSFVLYIFIRKDILCTCTGINLD